MYRHIDPPTTLDSVVFSVASGMVCGSIYAASLFFLDLSMGMLGGLFGLFGGLLLSPMIVAALRQGSVEYAGWIALLPAMGFSVLFGLIGLNPLLSLVIVATLFAALCVLSSRLHPATKPIDPFTCENCGYDLHGVNDITCPECGRERIVMPKGTSLPGASRRLSQLTTEAHRAVQDPDNLDVVVTDEIEDQELPKPDDRPTSEPPKRSGS
jgi:DNA-directed RNA polymerase subunit RPC12/RpoP